jgi:hypothetical protein
VGPSTSHNPEGHHLPVTGIASLWCYVWVLSFLISLGDKNTVQPLYSESVREHILGSEERNVTVVEKIVEKGNFVMLKIIGEVRS